jgi:hypothetical protein
MTQGNGCIMYLNTDELLLLSRGGRVAPVSRAGPRYRDWLEPHQRESLTVVRAWGRRSLRRRRTARLREALGGGGPFSRQPARAPQFSGYADRETYVELEFAVGFGAEEEQWL